MLLPEWKSVAKRRILYVDGEHWEDRLQEKDIIGSALKIQVLAASLGLDSVYTIITFAPTYSALYIVFLLAYHRG